ncbi:hypothetical protein BC940DRAFT_287306 [Gongronella butleri]|nr:hypothetical protein BC940DRAFT_287306 [Gongronella butleri]
MVASATAPAVVALSRHATTRCPVLMAILLQLLLCFAVACQASPVRRAPVVTITSYSIVTQTSTSYSYITSSYTFSSSSSSSLPSTPTWSDDPGSLTTGAIIGIAVGSAAASVAIALAFYCGCFYRRGSRKHDEVVRESAVIDPYLYDRQARRPRSFIPPLDTSYDHSRSSSSSQHRLSSNTLLYMQQQQQLQQQQLGFSRTHPYPSQREAASRASSPTRIDHPLPATPTLERHVPDEIDTK